MNLASIDLDSEVSPWLNPVPLKLGKKPLYPVLTKFPYLFKKMYNLFTFNLDLGVNHFQSLKVKLPCINAKYAFTYMFAMKYYNYNVFIINGQSQRPFFFFEIYIYEFTKRSFSMENFLTWSN